MRTPPPLADSRITVFIDYLDSTLETENETGKVAGLILSREALLNIKFHVQHSLALPTDLKSVKRYVGHETRQIPGLEPEELLRLYTTLRDHACQWKALEEQIGKIGTEISLFADTLLSQGDAIILAVDGLAFDIQLGVKSIDATLVFSTPVSPAPLSARHKSTVIELCTLLQGLADAIRQHEYRTVSLSNALRAFSHRLLNDLEPAVRNKIEQLRRSTLDQQIQALESEIRALQQTLAREQDARPRRPARRYGGDLAYQRTLRKWREQLAELTNRKNTLSHLHLSTEALQYSFERLQERLEKAASRMTSAHESASILYRHWSGLSHHITQSAERLQEVESAEDLFDFIWYFSALINPWRQVSPLIKYLLKVHYETLALFDLQQVPQPENSHLSGNTVRLI